MFEYKTQILFRFLCLAFCRSVCDECVMCIAFDSLKYNLFYLYVWTARAVMGRDARTRVKPTNGYMINSIEYDWMDCGASEGNAEEGE